jgi:hypothetical protein
LVVPLVRHWVKVRGDAFHHGILAPIERGECLGIHACDVRGEGASNEKQYDSKEAAKQWDQPTGPLPSKAIFSQDYYSANYKRNETCIGK